MKRVSYGGCLIDQRERDAINRVIDASQGRMWTLGEESKLFEQELAKVAGVRYAVVVNSGSSALLTAITALHLPKRSKIIIPACNFPTAFNSIVQAGHIPVVVDIDIKNFNISLPEVKKAIRRDPSIAGVIAVHIAGNSVNLIELRNIVGDRIIISDNCDGFGGTLKGKFIDTYSDISCISMHAAHIISMGEGGAVLTDNKDYADRSRKIREWGRASGSDTLTKHKGFPKDYRERYVFEEIGYNFKPLELQCAMGRVQLTKLPEFKKKRADNYFKMERIFRKLPRFSMVRAPFWTKNCWFGFPLFVHGDRGEVMRKFEENDIETRTVFSGNILKHPAYKDTEYLWNGSLENSDKVMAQGMFLSVHPALTDEQIEHVGKVARTL